MYQDRNYKDVKILAHHTAYQGYFRIDKYKLQFKKYSGSWTSTFEREIFERGDSAGVLLFDPKKDTIVLIEQFRLGAIKNMALKTSPWLIELVAGIIEPGEKPEDVIKREAKEEANLIIKHYKKICDYYVSPGGSTEKMHLYLAYVDANCVEGIFGLESEHEDIRVRTYRTFEIDGLLEGKKIQTAHTLIALHWFKINHCDLKKN